MEEITQEIISERAPDAPGLPENDPETPEEAHESIADRTRIISPARLVLKRFFRSKLSVVGLCLFLFLLIFSFLGPLFVPWGEAEVDRSGGQTTYTQYTTEFVGADGETYTVVQLNSYTPQINVFAPVFSYGTNADGEEVMHILGTDRSGMDIMARLMYGGRISLTISFLAVIQIGRASCRERV